MDKHWRKIDHPLLEDLLGVIYEYTEPKRKGFLDSLKGKVKRSQIIVKKTGKGEVIYANFSIFLEIRNGSKKWLKAIRRQVK